MKKKLLLSLCLMAIAVVAFCLWYTRPQTFWQATGTAGSSGQFLVLFQNNLLFSNFLIQNGVDFHG